MFDNRLTFEEDEIKAIKIFESTGNSLTFFDFYQYILLDALFHIRYEIDWV